MAGGRSARLPWQCKEPYESRECRGRGTPCSADLAGKTGVAQSPRDTAKPSGWEDAQNPAWMLSTQTLLPPVLPYEHLQVDGVEGRWANGGCLSQLSPASSGSMHNLMSFVPSLEKSSSSTAPNSPATFHLRAPRRNGAGQKNKLFCVSSSARKGIKDFPIPFPAQSASL